MTAISLNLIGPNGDDLGRLALPDLEIGHPGQSAGRSVSRDIDREMTDLCAGIRAVVNAEGLKPNVDEIGLRLAVSKALMTAGEDCAEILVPVMEARFGEADSSAIGNRLTEDQPVADWDSLLDCTEGGNVDV